MSNVKENEPGIVWCKPWGEDQGAYVCVQACEFDPEIHTAFDADESSAPAKPAAKKVKGA